MRRCGRRVLLLRSIHVDLTCDVMSHVTTLSGIGFWALRSRVPLLLYAFLSGWLNFSNTLIFYAHMQLFLSVEMFHSGSIVHLMPQDTVATRTGEGPSGALSLLLGFAFDALLLCGLLPLTGLLAACLSAFSSCA